MKRASLAMGALVICAVCAIDTSVYADDAQELFKKGQKAYNNGDYEQAIKFYEDAIGLDSDFAEAYNGLGVVYRSINSDPSTIMWYFKTAIEIRSDYAEACDNLGRIYYAIGNFDKAEEYAKKALSINPNMNSAYYALAWIYLLGKSQPETAVFYFNKILELREIPFAYYGLGLAYLMSNQRAPVLEIVTKLRGIEHDKLATKLEDMLRKSDFYLPSASKPLVSIRPPPEMQEEAIQIPGGESRPIDLGGKTMKIRLRGSLVGVDELDKAKDQQ